MPDRGIIIVGAGLTGSLIALALSRKRAGPALLLLEGKDRFGGGPILPYFPCSIPVEARGELDPFIVREWSEYYLAGPGFSRLSSGALAHLAPEQIHAEVIENIPEDNRRSGTTIAQVDGRDVVTDGGFRFTADLVIDLRRPPLITQASAWRHTTTRIFRFPGRHGLENPILLDPEFKSSGWSYLQYYPVSPDTLLINYCRMSLSPEPPTASDPDGVYPGGILMSEQVRIQAFGEADQQRSDSSEIRYSPARVTLWHPLVSSSVAGSVALARAVAGASGIEELSAQLKQRKARAAAYERLFDPFTAALCANDPAIRQRALSRYSGSSQQVLERLDACDAIAAPFLD